jgi:hypothetical protein
MYTCIRFFKIIFTFQTWPSFAPAARTSKPTAHLRAGAALAETTTRDGGGSTRESAG